MTTKEAVEQLVRALQDDRDYYDSWKANIAISFYDQVRRTPEDKLIANANNAADEFLQMLIRTTDVSDDQSRS